MSQPYDPFAASDPADIPPPRRRQRTTWPWLLAGMVIVAIVSVILGAASDYQGSGSIAEDLGYGLGGSIIQGLLLGGAVYLAIYFVALRTSGRSNGTKYLGILIATAVLCGTGMAVLNGWAGQEKATKAAVRTVAEQSFARADARQLALAAELEKVPETTVFTPRALKAAGGHARAMAELARRRELIVSARTGMAADEARTRADLAAAVSRRADRARLIANYDRGAGSRGPEVERYWVAQTESLDNLEAELTLLQHANWAAQGGKFMFYSPRDLAAFSALAQKQQDLASEVEQLTAGINARTHDARSEARRALAD